MKQNKAYKFRLKPNNTQKTLLNKTFGSVRYAWNMWVSTFNNIKIKEKEYKSSKELREDHDWMKEISSAAVQQKYRDFIEFKRQFFSKKRKKKVGRPSFKSKYKRQSYRLPNQKFTLSNDNIRLERIGKIKVILDRAIPEDVKFLSVTVSKDLCGDYFVSVLVEEDISYKSITKKAVGVDVGLKEFATLSDGEVISNPRFFRESQSELKRLQKHFSRKKKGSNKRGQAKIKIAKLHRKIARQREWFTHQLSSYLVNNYDIISIEDLNIAGMVKNRKLSKSIQDASWSILFNQLEYKSKWFGRALSKIDRFYPSSKTCSKCGKVKKDLKLSDRVFKCECGFELDRDLNASYNIKTVGVNAVLQTWRDCKTNNSLLAHFSEALKIK